MLKFLGAFTVGLLAVTLATAEDKKAGFDPAKLVGEWKYVSGVRGGEKVPAEHLAGKVIFTKDTVTVPADEKSNFLMAYKIDASKTPATIDLDIKDGPIKEGKALGLISFEGDELKIIYTPEGDRPGKFESTKENKAFYFVLKKAAK